VVVAVQVVHAWPLRARVAMCPGGALLRHLCNYGTAVVRVAMHCCRCSTVLSMCLIVHVLGQHAQSCVRGTLAVSRMARCDCTLERFMERVVIVDIGNARAGRTGVRGVRCSVWVVLALPPSLLSLLLLILFLLPIVSVPFAGLLCLKSPSVELLQQLSAPFITVYGAQRGKVRGHTPENLGT
jgi:hypothetical protein